MRCHAYLRQGRVFIPTFALVDKGLYRDIEPVAVVDVSETEAMRRAFRETIARGNPPAGPYPQPNPLPVVVKYAGLKSWSAFARGASPWIIDARDGHYQIIGHQRKPNNFAVDPEQTVDFPQGTTLDEVIDRLIAILQATARKSQSS
jgi:hypothetical protein